MAAPLLLLPTAVPGAAAADVLTIPPRILLVATRAADEEKRERVLSPSPMEEASSRTATSPDRRDLESVNRTRPPGLRPKSVCKDRYDRRQVC